MLYAHTDTEGSLDNGQTLDEHLRNVSELCASFAKKFGYERWGYALGLLHDAGKASAVFQRRLSGCDVRVDHATAGAQYCTLKYGGQSVQKIISTLMSLAIAGHHGGMPNVTAAGERTSLHQRLLKDVPDYESEYICLLAESGLSLPSIEELEPLPPLRGNRNLPVSIEGRVGEAYGLCSSFSLQLLGRLLFSCLVDADYLDTERFVSPEVSKLRAREYVSLSELLSRLNAYMQCMKNNAPDTSVNKARSRILDDCAEAAEWNPGLFTLSVPTGGGKTLSSMEFALRHAVLHGKSRIIYAIPFTSIAQQTAGVFRSIFGEDNVLEHHSAYRSALFDDEHEGESDEHKKAERLVTQNWDAPIVITTNVQLLESLYSNKPSKCRKLHNIVNSVIVFDEAQTLPDSLLRPTLAMLEGLCVDFSTSVVLCTATQPSLSSLWPFGSCPREISRNQDFFDEAFAHRVQFEAFCHVTQESLAEELNSKHQVLCVVGTKKKARELYSRVVNNAKDSGTLTYGAVPFKEGFYHLSTNMVAQHRAVTLEAIRRRLARNERCVVISTQLIEAGVDVDFPEAYREIAGIDSLMQVAGRCNREGTLEDAEGNPNPGVVHVFEYEEDLERGEGDTVRSWLGAMKSISKTLLEESGGVVSQNLIEPYFSARYATNVDELDRGNMIDSFSRLLPNLCETLEYESYAHEYKIIDDTTEPIYVAWNKEGRRLIELARRLSETGESAALFIPLQQYSVGVYPHVLKQLKQDGSIEEVGDYSVLVQDGIVKRYSDETGLLPVDANEPNNLIV
ncbi:MAG: CRISPR-associated helicase Cas3' [Coriobacteriales bacterium]|nr:CRISPR-associated helicase Cas3' [Coriobacteriales bacterium]